MHMSEKGKRIFQTLLKERGIGEEEQTNFLNPDFSKLHDPLLIPDMEKARDKVIETMLENGRIMIFSDYDADGIPGAVVMADFFRRAKYENVTFYIPHRHDEGFGLNCEAIDKAKTEGAKLLITVDCGVADIEEVAYANKNKIDVIITDHHEPKAKLPKAVAVVDIKRKDSKYPFKELCGAATAYKLVQAILMKESFGIKPGMEKWSLDMVGIATLSDMVPLVGENRILASFGLDVLRKSPRPGLAALLKKLSINQTFLTEDDIAFMITPRINAASRMGVPMDAFKLLSSADPREADTLADHLEKINAERKGIVAALVKDAKSHLNKRELGTVIVIGNPEWRPALLGLVANTLVEEFMRPAFVWGRDGDGVIKGSCRSYNGYSLIEIMNGASECFIEFGGHEGAGGFSVSTDNIHTLEEELSKAFDKLGKRLEKIQDKFGIEIDVADIGEELWSIVSALGPYGVGNPKPIFRIPSEITSVKQFGKAKDHLEIYLRNQKGRDIKAISFFSNDESFGTPVKPNMKAEVHAHLEKSYFINRPELRLRIVDIKA